MESNNHHLRRHLSVTDPQPNNLNKTIAVLFIIFVFLTITYLILNFIWKCLRRFIQPPPPPPPPTTTTTSTDHVQRDPVRMAQVQAIPVVIKETVDDEKEKESCSICLGEYQKEDEVRVLPQCKHLFHKACIDEWLLERSSFCPVCRTRVIPRRLEFDKNILCMQRNSNNNNDNDDDDINGNAHYPPFP
ncbi:Zinc finger RING/FYVE/PHD-type protein [Dioscorea alata]|uniref:Zinc finger RING/FYVE/PHD-type protein n=1 Tax=Dioscorea alata TaxID=55571 RepID=A0ACB7WUU8_DIOAL|nr:Zinc finger RING/FYVE/PHD-type protein [Dioscorea alata]